MVYEEWNQVIAQGTIGNLIKSIAESEAEIARYLEYLFLEKKWKTARNISSLTHNADLISRRRHLARSATGFVIVSHTDNNSKDRLGGYGGIYFDLDQRSDWDDLTESTTATPIEKEALVPWTADATYVIPRGTIFRSASGTEFISVDDVESRSLKIPYSEIESNEDLKNDFIRSGGWNGIKYLKVPVIQGSIVETVLGVSKGAKFESFAIDSTTVESGDNSVSSEFFTVHVGRDLSTAIKWERVERLQLAGRYDRVYEVKYLSSTNRVLIKFGDGLMGMKLTAGDIIFVSYLDTMGTAGNISNKFQIASMSPPSAIRDPRTGMYTDFLSCTNIVPIMGGRDIELEDDFRANAPASYLQSYTIGSSFNYVEKIDKLVPVSTLHLRVFASDELDTIDVSDKSIETVSGIISSFRKKIKICALRTNGSKFDDGVKELIEPIDLALHNIKPPNDSLEYKEPVTVEIKTDIVVKTSSVLSDELRQSIMTEILSKYNVFNSDFKSPMYKSVMIENVKSIPSILDTSIVLNAKAEIGDYGVIFETSSNPIIEVPFKFNKLFSSDIQESGFKNYRVSYKPMIRVDVIFKTGVGSMTFFLIDNRTMLTDYVALNDARHLPVNTELGLPEVRSTEGGLTLYQEMSEIYHNRQSRVAQFDLIDSIMTPEYTASLLNYKADKKEIRPLIVKEGKNTKFLRSQMSSEEQSLAVSLSFALSGSSVTDEYCFKKDAAYFNDTVILFEENFSMPDSDNYASGSFLIRASDLLKDDATMFVERLAAVGYSMSQEELYGLIQNNADIVVTAVPMSDSLETSDDSTIIYTSTDDIKIERL